MSYVHGILYFHEFNSVIYNHTMNDVSIKHKYIRTYIHILLTCYNKQQLNISYISSSCLHHQISYRTHKRSGGMASVFAKYND